MSLTTTKALLSLLGERERKSLRETFADRAGFDEPLAPYTSWRIGGPADALVCVESEDELSSLMRRIASS